MVAGYLGDVASFRDVHLCGDLLFFLIREISFQQADSRRITTERLPGETVNCPEWNLHRVVYVEISPSRGYLTF